MLSTGQTGRESMPGEGKECHSVPSEGTRAGYSVFSGTTSTGSCDLCTTS
jgi:hypothetical protein